MREEESYFPPDRSMEIIRLKRSRLATKNLRDRSGLFCRLCELRWAIEEANIFNTQDIELINYLIACYRVDRHPTEFLRDGHKILKKYRILIDKL